MTLAERAAADLRLVATYWPGLAETRIPGTPPPYQQPAITPERRAELDHEARIERQERDGLAPGEHPDAVRVEVLDLMGKLLVDAYALAEEVALASWCPPPAPPSTAFVDPSPWLDFTARNLDGIDEQFAGVLPYVAETARQMLAEVSRSLCLMHDGQRLKTVCPWCGGGLVGEPTWVVRQLPGDEVAIVCESGICEPPTRDVGTWWRGRPCWPMREWDWLAKRVTAAEQRGKVAS